MSSEQRTTTRAACAGCLRRGWLLAELTPILDRNCRADGRLFELLALDDERLIDALGGRRREWLHRGLARASAVYSAAPRAGEAICVHDRDFPDALRDLPREAGMPRLLYAAHGFDRLRELAGRPAVAILGTVRPSQYGQALAHDLARELAVSGVVVIAQRVPGIAFAAQQGALEAGGATLLVAGDGLGVQAPKGRRATYEALAGRGCVVSELPERAHGRSWGAAAAVRIAVGLAALVVLVEAREEPRDLRGAELARRLGRGVAALPGPVSSPTSAGCHALLRDGARLVRGASDVLELLYGVDPVARQASSAHPTLPWLDPPLRELIQRVGEGVDTIGGLAGGDRDPGEVLQALSELELLGLLVRVDRARYAVATPTPRRSAT